MTEQQLIKTVEEALEAEKQGRLEATGRARGLGRSSCLGDHHLRGVIGWLEEGLLSWKPTEYEYVTMDTFSFQDFLDDKYERDTGSGIWKITSEAPFDWNLLERQIDGNRLRRKKVEGGGEIELVEMSHVQPLGPVIYVLEGQEPFHSNYERTGRTFKGVIHEE